MSELIAALVGLISSVLVTGVSLYGARRLGLGQEQTLLITTYKDIQEADKIRIEQLEFDKKECAEEISSKDLEIAALERENASLKQTIVTQAAQLAEHT